MRRRRRSSPHPFPTHRPRRWVCRACCTASRRSCQLEAQTTPVARARRWVTRNVDAPWLGLKHMSLGAQGLMTEPAADEAESEEVVSRERGRRGCKKCAQESLSANKVFGRKELEWQTREISRDKENLHVRRVRLPPPMSLCPRRRHRRMTVRIFAGSARLRRIRQVLCGLRM